MLDSAETAGEHAAGSSTGCGPWRSQRWPSVRTAATRVVPEYHRDTMAEERELSLKEQLEEIGAQLDWVRGYL